MFRRIIAAASIAVLLTACTQSGGSDDSGPSGTPGPPAASDPVLAFVLPSEGVLDTTRILSKGKSQDVEGLLRAVLPNGSVLIDRNVGGDVDKPSYPVLIDPATGQETSGRKAFDADTGIVGFGRDSMLVVNDDGTRYSLREFGFDFKQIRDVTLPGKSVAGNPDANRYRTYGDAVQGDGAIFVTRTEWKGINSIGDSVTRVGSDGTITTLLKNKHVDKITLASDGKTVLAALSKKGPSYEGGARLADVVELDARSGKIMHSYGVPAPCSVFKALFDSGSCLDGLDKVGGTVAMTIFESRKPNELERYSTWQYENGAWTEVKSQRNMRVVWQSHSTRIQHPVDPHALEENPTTAPIEWVVGDKVTKLPGTSSLGGFDWSAKGSIIRP
jgi:hypothetical protein